MWTQIRSASIFKWKYSNWSISLIAGLGFAFVLADKFAFSYFWFILAAVWASVSWLASSGLEKRRPKARRSTKKNPNPLPPSDIDRRNYKRWRMYPIVGIAVLLLSICAYTRWLQVQHELQSLEGWLYPDSEDIATSCESHRKPDDLVVMIGSTSYVEHAMPHRIIVVNCDTVLGVNRDHFGRIGISLSIIGRDGKIITKIEDGHFTVNPNNIFKIERKGRSTISVIDQYDHEVLYMHLVS
jgi:hypothetical protein